MRTISRSPVTGFSITSPTFDIGPPIFARDGRIRLKYRGWFNTNPLANAPRIPAAAEPSKGRADHAPPTAPTPARTCACIELRVRRELPRLSVCCHEPPRAPSSSRGSRTPGGAPLALGVPACESLGETRRDLVVQEHPPLTLPYGSAPNLHPKN